MENKEKPLQLIWDLPELLVRIDNDHELLRELLTIFKQDSPRLLRSLKIAVAEGNLNHVMSLSHTLKGMFSNLGGTRAAEAVSCLEKLATAGEKNSLPPAMDDFIRETDNLLLKFRAYMTEVRN